MPPETALDEGQEGQSSSAKQIHALLVNYQDDKINACVHAALRGKKRVHYKCMDAISSYLAFGTSVGAIYLFRLATVSQSSCKLILVLPCDQGPIDVIKFVPNHQANGLLVVIGTNRGSIVIFQLDFTGTHNVKAQEIYRAEKFTKSESIGIKFIEHDQDLLEPCQPFTKLYICDQKCRIFVLDSNSIYPAFPLLYNNRPTPVLDVLESEVHQIFVHRSQLLLSTDERTQVFKEYSARPDPIGKTQRKRGFFGACFYNANYKPTRLQQIISPNRISASQQTVYSSTASLADMENLIIFVARPKFSLWQVNYKREVLFTHKFESSIKSAPSSRIVLLHNEPLKDDDKENEDEEEENQNLDDNPEFIIECFNQSNESSPPLRSDHFEKLIPIFSSTLGNLLLSHTRHDIFIIDPMSARLVVWHSYEKPIQQICCNENEIFILFEVGKRNYQVDRIVLLAPTQFVLELHRLNRRLSLMAFVELFSEQFRSLMALPLSGPSVITTEGGLLRNIIWGTWREFNDKYQQQNSPEESDITHATFKSLVDEIINESIQLRHSIENLADSQLFFIASNDNIERLCTEPYASMVSLDISIANLHTNHVVHFSQGALNRQKSLAKLSQSIMNLNQLKRTESARMSLLDLNEDNSNNQAKTKPLERDSQIDEINCMRIDPNTQFNDKKVFVEPIRTLKSQHNINNLKMRANQSKTTKSSITLNKIDEVIDVPKFSSGASESNRVAEVSPDPIAIDKSDEEQASSLDELDLTKCPECKWPKPRAHLKPMQTSQQIQFGWIQENWVPNFEENLEKIEGRAFKHGLWHLVLKCLAFKNKLDDYINCCIMLDDVTLLNMERFIGIKCSEEEFIDLVFRQLEQKQEFHDEINNRKLLSDESDNNEIYQQLDLANVCLRCKHVSETSGSDKIGNNHSQFDEENINPCHEMDDDISFNLVNLFKKIMLRKSADIKRAVATLLRYPKLLDRSKLPASFYLQVLSNQCSILRRTRLKV